MLDDLVTSVDEGGSEKVEDDDGNSGTEENIHQLGEGGRSCFSDVCVLCVLVGGRGGWKSNFTFKTIINGVCWSYDTIQYNYEFY